jgi:hypothetical protein
LQATGGNGVINWKLKDGKLTVGLTLREDGMLSGCPGEEGTFNVTFEASDSDATTPDATTKAMTLTVGPADGDVLLVRKASKPPVIDGKADAGEWTFGQKIEKRVAGAAWNNSAAFDAVWDKEKLHVAVRVTDGAVKAGDGVEIFIDGLNNREATYNFDDRLIVLSPAGDRSRAGCIGDMFLITTKGSPVEGGYLIEAAIPWKNFGHRGGGFANLTIGLDVAVTDDSGAGVVWRGTADNATNPSQFGTIILTEK